MWYGMILMRLLHLLCNFEYSRLDNSQIVNLCNIWDFLSIPGKVTPNPTCLSCLTTKLNDNSWYLTNLREILVNTMYVLGIGRIHYRVLTVFVKIRTFLENVNFASVTFEGNLLHTYYMYNINMNTVLASIRYLYLFFVLGLTSLSTHLSSYQDGACM